MKDYIELYKEFYFREPVEILFISFWVAFVFLCWLLKKLSAEYYLAGDYEEIKYKIKMDFDFKNIIYHIISVLVIVVLYWGFNNFFPSRENFYFYKNDYLFGFSVLLIAYIVIFTFDFIKYKYNRLGIIKNLCKAAIALSFIEFVALCYFRQTNNWPYVITYMVLSGILIVAHCIFSSIVYETEEDEYIYCETPVENKADLIPSRARQVDFLINEFRDISTKEPYAVMLDGKWGQGKTSLIRALENCDNEFKYVRITLGYSVNIKAILEDIEKQIRNIFNEERFYSKSDKNLHAYFKMMCDLSSVTVDENIGKIVDAIDSRSTIENAKNDINKLLDEFRVQTGKRVVIIIDDLERCHPSNIKYVFALLIETCNIHNSLSLLVCDYQKLIQTKAVTEEYIDKYINRKYRLAVVTQEDAFYDIIIPALQKKNLRDDSYLLVGDDFWEEIFDSLVFLQKRLNDVIFDNLTVEAYGIPEQTYLLFKNYSMTVLERLEAALINPRTVKKVWLLGILSACEDLFSSNYRGGLYDDININHVVALYGLITYVFSSIHYEILDANGIEQYIVRHKNKRDLIEADIKYATEQYYDFVLIQMLLVLLNDKEKRALNWLLLLKNTQELNDYKSTKEKVCDEWADKTQRTISHYDQYVEYVLVDMESLKELLYFLVENIESLTFESLELTINAFVNTYNIKNDPYGEYAVDFYKKIKKCIKTIENQPAGNVKVGKAGVLNAYNIFYEFLETSLYKRIAEIVWIMTLPTMEIIQTENKYLNVADINSYISFLQEIIHHAAVADFRKEEFDRLVNRYNDSISKGAYDLTCFVIDVCLSENTKFLKEKSENEEFYYWGVIKALLNHVCLVYDEINYSPNKKATSNAQKDFDTFCEPVNNDIDRNLGLLEVIINNWEDIDESLVVENCDLAMNSAKTICIDMISAAISLNKYYLNLADSLIDLIEKLYINCKEAVNDEEAFARFYEIAFLIKAAKNEIINEKMKNNDSIMRDDSGDDDSGEKSS